MSYSEPQTITVGAIPFVLKRTGMAINSGQFTTADGTGLLKSSHAYGKRTRRTSRFEHSKIAADPLTAANTRYSMSGYIVLDVPPVGYTVAEAKDVAMGHLTWLTATSGANLASLLGGES